MSGLAPEEFLGDLEFEYRLIWEAVIGIDQKDPFFFDHPLDHVPAMLLIEAALGLAGQAAAAGVGSPRRWHIGRLRLDFVRFCELSPPPVARLWAVGAPGSWEVEFRQDGQLIGQGTLEWRGGFGDWPEGSQERRQGAEVAALSPEPVAAELVHRSRPQNVLLGGVIGGCSAEMLTPPPGHYFRRRSSRLRTLGELIEAVRQFGTLVGHTEGGIPPGHQFIVKSCEVRLDRPLSRAQRVTLHLTQLRDRRGRGAGTVAVGIEASGQLAGAASFTGQAVSAAAYRRIRAMGR